MAVQRVTAWFRNMPQHDDAVSARPVTVHRRDIRDYADDLKNAQRRKEIALQAVAQADQQIMDAQAAFIRHCQEEGLALAIDPGIWPPKDWTFEDEQEGQG